MSVSKVAKNVGSFFFNILHLDCVQPVYPKVCVETTTFHRIRRFLNWDISKPPKSEIIEDCSRWEEDHDANPIDIKFLKTSKSF